MHSLLFGLSQKLRRLPLRLPVGRGDVVREGGKAVANLGAFVAGDTPLGRKDLPEGLGKMDLHETANEATGHAVTMVGDDDMLVKIDAGFAPLPFPERMGGLCSPPLPRK